NNNSNNNNNNNNGNNNNITNNNTSNNTNNNMNNNANKTGHTSNKHESEKNSNKLPDTNTTLASENSNSNIATGQSTTMRVRSKLAFLILEKVYSATMSRWTRMEILTRILIIMYQASNVQFIIDLHAIAPLLLRMPTVGQEERKKVVSILEFVIQSVDADSPPLIELSTFKHLLQQTSCDKDMLSLLLQTIKKIIIEKPPYNMFVFTWLHCRRAFRAIGVVETLMDHIERLSRRMQGALPVLTSPNEAFAKRITIIMDTSYTTTDIKQWQTQDVIQWFDTIDSGKFANRFHDTLEKLQITGQVLLTVKDDEWLKHELGVQDEMQRYTIRNYLNELKQVKTIFSSKTFDVCSISYT
ncbi:hypothetical protein RFI_26201, partial [Reticulomyxa filosa]